MEPPTRSRGAQPLGDARPASSAINPGLRRLRKLLLVASLVAPALALAAPDRLRAQSADAIETIPGAPQAHAGRGDREGGHGQPRGPRGPSLFISPSGEPFRGGDGLAAWFAQADADHDGSISLAEFQADARRAFRLYDENGDGVVDGFEIQDYERRRAPEISQILVPGEDGGRRHGRGTPPGAGREGAARFSLLNEPEPLLAADADVDGKVTLGEWTRATDRRFAQLDKDRTGRLTLEKLRPAKPKS